MRRSRLPIAWLCCLLMLFAVILPTRLGAQATAPALTLGSVGLGSSVTGTVTFTFSAQTTVGSIAVLTQGAAGKDFQLNSAAPGSCTANTYAANATCTVGVKFAPLAPGLRLGAAVLLDGNQNKVATSFVSGIGTGGLAALPLASAPATRSSIGSYAAISAVYDGSGNLYTSTNAPSPIYEFKADGTLLNSFSPNYQSSYPFIFGLAIDGAGFLYVSELEANQIVRFDPATGVSSQTTYGPAVTDPEGIAFDASGNLYVADYTGIEKITPAGTLTTIYADSGNAFVGIAVDPAGNIYYQSLNGGHAGEINSIYKIPAGQTQPVLILQYSASVSYALYGIAVDAAGNIFFGVSGNGIYEIPVGTNTASLFYSGSATQNAIAISGTGQIAFSTDDTSITSFNRLAQALNTPANTVTLAGAKSAAQSVTVENDGDASLNFTAFTGAGAAAAMSGYSCAIGTPLAVDATCTVGVQFAPTASGSPQTGTLTLMGNTPNSVISIKGYVTGDPVKLAFASAPPATLQNGQNAGTVTVAVQDNAGGPTTSTASVTLAVTGSNSYSQNYTATAVNGTATFSLSGAALPNGTYTYTATSNGLTSATAAETVYPYKLVFTTQPATPITAGGNAGTFTVAIEDHSGTIATAQTSPISLSVTGPSYSNANITPTSFSNGVATFNLSGTTLTTSGTYTYTASSSGLTSGMASEIVSPAAATQLALTAASSTPYATAGDAITIKALDPYGNVAANTDTVTITTSDAAATGTGPVTLSNGTGTATLRFRTAGSATVTGTDSTNSGVTSAAISVNVQPIPVFTVTVLTDPATGTAANCTNQALSGAVADSNCSLRDAVAAVNALAITGSSSIQPVIDFAPALYNKTITLTAQIVLTANVNMMGPGPSSTVTISGGNTTHLFQQTTGSTGTSISGLTLANAASTASGSVLSSPVASSTFSFTNDVFSGNNVSGSGLLYGGALYLTGSPAVSISGCTFQNNKVASTTTSAYGGALYQTGGSLSISNSPQANTVFNGNQAQAQGTGLAEGGAIVATGLTGGITVSGSSFLSNKATSAGTNGAAYGGAAYIANTGAAALSITNTLFSNNTAAGQFTTEGGALLLSGNSSTTFTGSTLTNNTATYYSSATNQLRYGGAIYTANAIKFYNVTIVGNSASGGTTRGGGVYAATSGSTAYNTVISGNSVSGTPTYIDAYNISASASNYIDASTTSTCTANCAPLLSALGSYGGPTQTRIPLPGSPLLAAGSTSNLNGATTDARGFPRTLIQAGSTNVDIGATEANYSLGFQVQPTSTTIGTNFSPQPTVQLYESGALFSPGASGGTVKFSDASGTLSGATVTITNSGLAQLTAGISKPQTNDTLISTVKSGATGTPTLASATSSLFNITDPNAASINYVTPPAYTVVNGGNAGVVKVGLYTSSGTLDTSAASSVTLTVSGPSSYSQTATAINGVATFDLSSIPLTMNGSYSYVASSPYTTDTVTAQESVGSQVLGSFTLAGVPALAYPGTAYTLTVTAKDTTGATFTGFTGPVTLSSSDAAAMFSEANYTFSASDAGVHNFTVTFNTSGTQSATATTNGSATGSQTGILVDGYIWLLNATGTTSKLTPTGSTVISGVGTTSTSAATQGGIAADSAGGIWSVTPTGNALDFINNKGTAAATYGGGGLNAPAAVAIDGAGTVWVANSGNNSVSLFTNSGTAVSPTTGFTGYQGASYGAPSGVAIDVSGNVWVSNSSTNTVTEILGAAAPVAPLATALTNSTTGARP